MSIGETTIGARQHPIGHLEDAPILVEVRNRFDGTWSHGFAVVESLIGESDGPQFRLRRLSDGYLLPVLFTADDIIAHRPQ